MSDRYMSSANFPTPTREQLKAIITNDSSAEILVAVSKELGEALAKPLATSQIRAIFGEVMRIKADWLQGTDEHKVRAKRAFILLRPKLAYRGRREKGQAVAHLTGVLSQASELVEGNDDNFRRFIEFFEAILAYHRAAGGN